jgi:hypothetical protein
MGWFCPLTYFRFDWLNLLWDKEGKGTSMKYAPYTSENLFTILKKTKTTKVVFVFFCYQECS